MLFSGVVAGVLSDIWGLPLDTVVWLGLASALIGSLNHFYSFIRGELLQSTLITQNVETAEQSVQVDK